MPDITPKIGYNLVISQQSVLIHNAVYPSAAERRDAVVAILRTLSDRVKATDVMELLLSYGGADPDQAANTISHLYMPHGVRVYLHDVPENLMDAPGLIHSVVISYNHSASNEIVNCRSLAARETYLRNRLIDFGQVGIAADVSHDYLALKLQEAMKEDTTLNFPASIHLLTSLASSWSLS